MNLQDREFVGKQVEYAVTAAARESQSLFGALVKQVEAAEKARAIGLCGYCGGQVRTGSMCCGGAHPGDAKCSQCGASPEPMKMQDRRQETRPAPERRKL